MIEDPLRDVTPTELFERLTIAARPWGRPRACFGWHSAGPEVLVSPVLEFGYWGATFDDAVRLAATTYLHRLYEAQDLLETRTMGGFAKFLEQLTAAVGLATYGALGISEMRDPDTYAVGAHGHNGFRSSTLEEAARGYGADMLRAVKKAICVMHGEDTELEKER